MFACDHGDFSSAYGVIGKSWCKDDRLLRIPLIVAGPGIAAGTRTDALVENIDLLPTMLDVAGATPNARMHGRSLCPLLHGETAEHRDAVFACGEYHTADTHLHQSMIRTDRWKFVQSHDFKGELYDMATDPRETTNLIDAPAHAGRVAELRQRLCQWQLETSGGWFDHDNAGYWEERTHFYDESRFTGG
jgi:arylsulfatase A-like enzyme